ncbi:WD40/YVTN/BNR-like repeat-containing protein [Zoogloea sp.]|uniref:WD40/YVTN/BNR-like repeat-containing protein n=1 Tax=Zoogloea sp. TaxID=49181 RepID=UPI0035B197D3
MKLKLTASLTLLASLAAGIVLATSPASPPAAGEVPAMKARLATRAGLVAVSSAGETYVAVGDYGTIVRSSDGGNTWQQAATVPVSGLLTSVSFADAKNGWAVGHGGIILVTRDGGETWAIQHTVDDKPVLLSVHFTDAEHGFVVGAYGTALQTSDGGKNWEPMQVGEGRDADLHLNHVFSGPSGTLFAAGESGSAFRSKDGGLHWERLNTGATGSLWSGLQRKSGQVLLLGMSGKVLESTDLGDHWKSLETGTNQALTGGVEKSDGGLVLVGTGGAIVTDKDGQLVTGIRDDRQNLAAVASGGGNLILLGQNGLIKDSQTH